MFIDIINMVNMLTTVSTSVCRGSTGEGTRHVVGSGCLWKCSTIAASRVDSQIAGRYWIDSIRESVCVIGCVGLTYKVRLESKIPRTWICTNVFYFHLDFMNE